jgi:hypothetical protein
MRYREAREGRGREDAAIRNQMRRGRDVSLPHFPEALEAVIIVSSFMLPAKPRFSLRKPPLLDC